MNDHRAAQNFAEGLPRLLIRRAVYLPNQRKRALEESPAGRRVAQRSIRYFENSRPGSALQRRRAVNYATASSPPPLRGVSSPRKKAKSGNDLIRGDGDSLKPRLVNKSAAIKAPPPAKFLLRGRFFNSSLRNRWDARRNCARYICARRT